MKRLLTLIALFAFPFFLFSQQAINWQRCLGGSDNDNGSSFEQTLDGGFIVSGSTRSSDGDVIGGVYGISDAWVVKLNSTGGIEWQNHYGGTNSDGAAAIHQTPDGGYIFAGGTSSNNFDVTGNHGGVDIWVVKLSSTGSIQWTKCLGGTSDEGCLDFQLTSDGGYILAGYSSSTNGDVTGNQGNDDYWVVKLNSAGNIQWQKCLGGTDVETAESICQTVDGGYVVAGTTHSTDGDVIGNHGWDDWWIVKLNSSGNIVWKKCFGGTAYDWAYSVRQTPDGGYIAGGSENSINGDVTGNHGGQDFWLVKLNSSGNLVWQKSFGGTGNDYGYCVLQTLDGGYAMAGYTNSNDGDVTNYHAGLDGWVVKADASGNLQWQNCMGGTNNDMIFMAAQTTANSIMTMGYTNSIDGDLALAGNHGLNDFWITCPQSDYNTITGTLFVDMNANNTFDTGDFPLSNKMVTEASTGRQIFTNQNGNYQLSVFSPGSFSVSPQSISCLAVSPSSHSAVFTGLFETDSLNHFAYVPLPGSTDLAVSIAPATAFRPGFSANYRITYSNLGTAPLSATIYFNSHSTHTSYQSASPSPTIFSGDTISWNIFILPSQQGNIIVTVHVNASTPIGTIIGASTDIYPIIGDLDPSNNVDGFEVTTTGSYDPNDKLVSNKRITLSQVSAGTYLDYVIRFQNTGTDTAFAVRILDSITTRLNMNTFQFVASSHPVELQYESVTRRMTFAFDNIFLPDSNVDEEGSHGFIHYRIKPLTSLPFGDSIKNQAVIVFDYNSAVVTNIAKTRILYPLSGYISSTNINCFGNSNGSATANAQQGLAPYTYQWSPVSATTQSINNLSLGTYTASIYDVDGYESIDSITITEPAQIILSSSQTNILCYGSSSGVASVLVTGGVTPYQYSWSNGGTLASITAIPAGIYTVTITDDNACTATTVFSILQPAEITLSPSQNNVLCYGDSSGFANISVAGGITPYQYTWSNSETLPAISGLPAGAYTVTTTDSNNCSVTAVIVIAQPVQLTGTMNSVPADLSCLGSAAINVSGGISPYSYLWSNSSTLATINNVCSGWYYVSVTDFNNCQISDSVFVNFLNGISDVSTASQFFISPNPATNQLAVSSEQWAVEKIEIFSTLGVKVFQSQTSPEVSRLKSQILVNITQLNSGIYFITIINKNGNKAIRKFVKY